MWLTANNEGTVGYCGDSKVVAEEDLKFNRELHPDEEWEMFNDDEQATE